MELSATTWTDIEATVGGSIVVVPVGSCEQHGPHLPLGTDTAIAVALAAALANRRSDCLVAPPLAITASGEHQGFPGTLSIGTDVMTTVVVELARSADWAAGVVFVNGHGGNAAAMQRAHRVVTGEGRRVLMWWPDLSDEPGTDLHAGHTETSILLAIDPDAVHTARAVAGPRPSASALVEHGVERLSPSGVLGDPTTATKAIGARLIELMADQLHDAVHEWVG